MFTISVFCILMACTTAKQPPVPVEETPPLTEATNPEPVVPDAPSEEAQPKEEKQVEAEESYDVSEELYVQTFNEIEELIAELNRVIAKKQYKIWSTFLSDKYLSHYSSAETINRINQYDQLKNNNIRLESLKDYFLWVVVPSRNQVILNEIVFFEKDRVVAYTSLEGQRVKLYEFEKFDGVWKVTL